MQTSSTYIHGKYDALANGSFGKRGLGRAPFVFTCYFFLVPFLNSLVFGPCFDYKAANKDANGRKIDGHRILTDIERGRTRPDWRPRRLGSF